MVLTLIYCYSISGLSSRTPYGSWTAGLFPQWASRADAGCSLWANDAGRAIANAALMNNTSGKTYKLAGPKQYTMKEVVEYVLETLETDVE